MITSLAHVCIEVDDLKKAEWFYCNVLGLKKKFDFIKDDELFGFYLEVGDGNYLEVFGSGVKSDEYARQRIRHFCLEVDDIDAIAKVLEANGVEARAKKMGADGSWQIWCEDPSGLNLEFHQYTDKSSQLTGENCIVNW